jgi:hypothetical protein
MERLLGGCPGQNDDGDAAARRGGEWPPVSTTEPVTTGPRMGIDGGPRRLHKPGGKVMPCGL